MLDGCVFIKKLPVPLQFFNDKEQDFYRKKLQKLELLLAEILHSVLCGVFLMEKKAFELSNIKSRFCLRRFIESSAKFEVTKQEISNTPRFLVF